jgi:hypothetical protein
VLLPVVEDLLRSDRTDTGKRVELLGGGRVQMHWARKSPTGRRVRADGGRTAAWNDDLLSVRDGGGEVDELHRGGACRAARTPDRIRNARTVRQTVETRATDSPDDIDVHGRRSGRRGSGDRNPRCCFGLRVHEELSSEDRNRDHSDCAQADLPPREVEVVHMLSVATKVARLGDDFVSKRRHTTGVFALVLTAAIALSTSGLHGTVIINPARPVCLADEPCWAPDSGDVLVFSRGGRRIAQTRTDAHGRYRVKLPAGIYTATAPRHQGIGRGLQPSRVVVPRGRYGSADFTLDIGIR